VTGAARRVAWLTVFAIAMGFLEAAVVVYLRELYYPEGFRFPLVTLSTRITLVELAREACTLAMLAAVAALSSRNRMDGFLVFAYLFGLWDLVYYAGLYIFLGWPASLMTWDILFLIPVPWAGPVLYPILISLAMVVGFFAHEHLVRLGRELVLTLPEWIMAVAGAFILILSFCWSWRDVVSQIVPAGFPFLIYILGFLLGMVPFLRAYLRSIRVAAR